MASGEWGGPQRYALDICRHFRSQGWKVRVITRDAKAVDTPFLREGISVRHAPLRDYPDLFSALMLARMMRRIPKGEGIVHVHRYNDALTAIVARLLARRPDIRLVSTRHRADLGRRGLVRRIVYAGIDSHLFVSEFSRQRFLQVWPEGECPVAEGRMSVAFNSLLTPEPGPCPEPERGPVVALYRGGLKPGKGLETLIDALSLLKDVRMRLRIVGRGMPDYVDQIRRRAVTRGVMERIDWVRRADFPADVIAQCHFGVFPSATPEAFGMANLELMACGRPQISTFTGGQKEFLTPGADALEVAPADASSLAEAMRRLATDPALRSHMGEQARRHYTESLSWPRFLERLLPAYLEGVHAH